MKTAWKVIVGVLAALLILLFAAEFGLRAYMADQIRSESAAADGTEVSFGSQPLTLGLARGVVPHMTMNSPSTLKIDGDTATGQPASTVEVDNMRASQQEQVAEHMTVVSELPDDYVRVMLQQQLSDALKGRASFLEGLITVSKVTSHPENGTFSIEFSDGAAGLELRPVMEGEKLKFTAESTELLGFVLPEAVAETISGAMEQGMQDAVIGSLKVTDFAVVDGGLRVTLAGDNVDLRQLQEQAPAP